MEPSSASPGGVSMYDRIGADGFAALTAAFYRRVAADDLLRPMYEASVGEDMAEAERKLRDFLVYRFGGPDVYIRERGHPRLRMRHMPFRIDRAGAARWLELMSAAMEEAGIRERGGDESVEILGEFFRQTAYFMVNTD